MFISKKHLSRRAVLRGMGASVALPLLDAMIPAGTALAQTAAAAKPKMGFFYLPHGAVMDRWRPTAAGSSFDLPQLLKPYEPFKDRMTIVSGLRNKAAEGAGVHTVNPGTWLSCSSPLWPKTGDAQRGVSADQLAARVLGADTLFPSLELCTEVKASSGQACNPEFGCGFGSTISFRGAAQPLPMEHSPRKLFYRLFGQGDTAAERVAIISQTGSLLDMVRESSTSLRGTLGAADQTRVAEYLDSVREIERQVQKMGDQDFSHLALPDAPAGVPASFDEHINLMFDLIALAYQSGLTRVVVVHDGGRDQHAAPTTRWASRTRSTRCRTTRTVPRRWRVSLSCRRITRRCSRAFWTSSRRRRTATARCSITRSCCTAAT